jgi:serine phosphatase RsbU (regulator of sigma subunit)
MAHRRTESAGTARELLQQLGDLTGRIMDQIKLQQARVELAAALQRQVLAAKLPALPGLQAAGRYTPARGGLDIGGDWYDGFLMPDGSVGFAIGDVQGHDVEAAAHMGQVRTCLHGPRGHTRTHQRPARRNGLRAVRDLLVPALRPDHR